MYSTPFRKALLKHQISNEKGRLFLLIGQRTFSSAIINAWQILRETEAISIGQPTGGRINGFGELAKIKLPFSGITLYYSTKYFQLDKDMAGPIVPEHLITYHIDEYIGGTDPALEFILNLN